MKRILIMIFLGIIILGSISAFTDEFEDGVMNNTLWINYTDVSGGGTASTLEHTSTDGYVSILTNTAGAGDPVAVLQSKKDYKDGLYYNITFRLNSSMDEDITQVAINDFTLIPDSQSHNGVPPGTIEIKRLNNASTTNYYMTIHPDGNTTLYYGNGTYIMSKDVSSLGNWSVLFRTSINTGSATSENRIDLLNYSSEEYFPGIIMNSPSDNYIYYNTENITFNITYPRGISNIKNISLVIDNTIKETKSITDTTQEVIFSNVMGSEGNVKWNILIGMTDGSIGYYSNNRTIKNTLQYSFVGDLAPTCSVTSGSISDSYLYQTGNTKEESISCVLDGYETYTETYNITDGDKNISMSANQLVLWFENSAGSLISTGGFWADQAQLQNFSGNNISLDISNFTAGIVKVYFNYLGTFLNYTQFYEFNNNLTGAFKENLTLINETDVSEVYVKVLDESNDPVDDALIRVTYQNPGVGGKWQEIGQRYAGRMGTIGNGITKFYIPNDGEVFFRVYKDGYDTYNLSTNIVNDVSSADPIVFPLKKSESEVYQGVMFRICSRYDNTTTTIPITVGAPSRDSVTFTTSYNSSSNWTISLDRYKAGTYTMIKGVHFDGATGQDLNVTVYVDGTLYRTYFIKYSVTDEDRFVEPSGLHTDTYYKLMWLGLILGVSIISLIFKGTDEEEGIGSRGKAMFLIGCIIIPIVLGGKFLYLLIVTSIYGISLILKKWISE